MRQSPRAKRERKVTSYKGLLGSSSEEEEEDDDEEEEDDDDAFSE